MYELPVDMRLKLKWWVVKGLKRYCSILIYCFVFVFTCEMPQYTHLDFQIHMCVYLLCINSLILIILLRWFGEARAIKQPFYWWDISFLTLNIRCFCYKRATMLVPTDLDLSLLLLHFLHQTSVIFFSLSDKILSKTWEK